MAHDTSALKIPSASADYDAVVDQLASLRADMAKLADAVTTGAQHRRQALTSGIADRMTGAADYVGRSGKGAETRFEGAVAANPFVALGIAVGVGLLFGAMSRR